MRRIGFSTGALALGDFRRAIEMLHGNDVRVVELSALRQHELGPMIEALPDLPLNQFEYVSMHAPSRMDADFEQVALSLLRSAANRGLPIVIHPDVITDFRAWAFFGELLLVENMDKRKPAGRTAQELERVFDRLPAARLCFDIGHAHQVDPSMSEAALILRTFADRLGQVHLSEVSTSSTHERLTQLSVLNFVKVSYLIRDEVPVILESRVGENEILQQIEKAREALRSREFAQL
jgi:hypothetical protein